MSIGRPSGRSISWIAGAFIATFLGQVIGWYRPDQGAGLIHVGSRHGVTFAKLPRNWQGGDRGRMIKSEEADAQTRKVNEGVVKQGSRISDSDK
jgi:hypothetical protein